MSATAGEAAETLRRQEAGTAEIRAAIGAMREVQERVSDAVREQLGAVGAAIVAIDLIHDVAGANASAATEVDGATRAVESSAGTLLALVDGFRTDAQAETLHPPAVPAGIA